MNKDSCNPGGHLGLPHGRGGQKEKEMAPVGHRRAVHPAWPGARATGGPFSLRDTRFIYSGLLDLGLLACLFPSLKLPSFLRNTVLYLGRDTGSVKRDSPQLKCGIG